MKRRMIDRHHHRGLPSHGPHLRYSMMTITAAALLAIGLLVISLIIGMKFFGL